MSRLSFLERQAATTTTSFGLLHLATPCIPTAAGRPTADHWD
jgi:hypothetical protein